MTACSCLLWTGWTGIVCAALRSKFVAHAGKKTLTVTEPTGKDEAD